MVQSRKKKKKALKNKVPVVSKSVIVIIISLSLFFGIVLVNNDLSIIVWLSPLSTFLNWIVRFPESFLFYSLFFLTNNRVILIISSLLAFYLGFFVTGFLVGLIAYKKLGKVIYWSLLFTLPKFLLNIFMALFSDYGPVMQVVGSVFSFFLRITIAVSPLVGYFLGIYTASKVLTKKK